MVLNDAKDEDVEVGEWGPSVGLEEYEDSTTDSDVIVEQRLLTYMHPVKSRFPGVPSHAGTSKTQIYEYYGPGEGLVMVEHTKVSGVPLSSYFTVHTVWRAVELAADSMHLTVTVYVKFTQRTMMKGKITSNTFTEQGDAIKLWVESAKMWLQVNGQNSQNNELQLPPQEMETEALLMPTKRRVRGAPLLPGDSLERDEVLAPASDNGELPPSDFYLNIVDGMLRIVRGDPFDDDGEGEVMWSTKRPRLVWRRLLGFVPLPWFRTRRNPSHRAAELRLRDNGILELIEGERRLWRSSRPRNRFGRYNAFLDKSGKLMITSQGELSGPVTIWSSQP
ncbi:unnamed protein product [Chrysoparadoxa australica]